MCGNPGRVEVKQDIRRLDENHQEDSITIDVPSETEMLQIAMNGEDSGQGKNEFEISVYRDDGSPTGRLVCEGNARGQFAFCAVEKPNAGSWTVAITRKRGAGDVQITATLVGIKK
jgi:hypothetical protein